MLLAQFVVFDVAVIIGCFGVAHDRWVQEHHQIAFGLFSVVIAEQAAEQWDVTQQRHFLAALLELVVNQTTENQCLLIFDHYRGLDGALVRGDIRGAGDSCRADAFDVLLNLHLDVIALVDLRFHLQTDTHIAALDCGERVGVGRGQRLSGNERQILTDHDLGFLVVHGDQRRSRENVVIGVRGNGC